MHKKYPRSFIKNRVEPLVSWTILTMFLLCFWGLNVSVALRSLQGQKALEFHQKYLKLCSEDEQMTYESGTAWRRVVKGIVHPKRKILSLITHPHVVPNPLSAGQLRNTKIFLMHPVSSLYMLSMLFALWSESKQRIRVTQLTQKSTRCLRSVDTRQNVAIGWCRGDKLLNKVIIFDFLCAQKVYS